MLDKVISSKSGEGSIEDRKKASAVVMANLYCEAESYYEGFIKTMREINSRFGKPVTDGLFHAIINTHQLDPGVAEVAKK